MVQNWVTVLQSSLQETWMGFANVVPKLVTAFIVVIIGWAVGSLLGKVVERIIKSLKVDNILRSAKIEDLLRRGGFNLNSGLFIGKLVEWYVIVAFLIWAFEVLGLTQVNVFLQQVVLYLPQVIVAAIIVLGGAIIAQAMEKVVSGAAMAGGFTSARLAGTLTRWAIWIFAILTALFQLNIAGQIIQLILNGVIIAIAIAVGLSFGLGGQEAAARAIERVRQEIANHHHQ